MPDLTKGHTFTSGESVDHSKLNNLVGNATLNDGAVTAAKLATGAVTSAKILDGTIADADISSVAAVALTKLADGSDGQIIVCNSSDVPTYVAMSGDATIDNAGAVTVTAAVPTGSMVMWYTASAPTGWLFCNGATFDAGTYPALNTLLGGNTLPDLKGRMPIGVGQGSTAEGGGTGTDRALAATGGAETHTLLTAEMPAHTHQYYGGNNIITASGASAANRVIGNQDTASGSTGGDGDHENMSPFLAVNFIIKT